MCVINVDATSSAQVLDAFFIQSNLRSFHRYIAHQEIVYSPGIVSMFSYLPLPFYNAVFCDDGVDQKTYLKQLEVFKERKVPFVWFAEENSDIAKDLIANGGKSVGVFQGGAAPIPLDKLIDFTIEGITLTRVQTQEDIAAQVDLLSVCLKLSEENKRVRLKIAQEQFAETSPLQHWIAIKEGKAIAVLGLFINKDCAMMMNAVTLEPYRKTGLATALAIQSMKYAVGKGCTLGMACIDPNENAKGIGLKFDGKAYWRYTPIVFSPNP